MMEEPALLAAMPSPPGKSFMKLGVPIRLIVPTALISVATVALTHAIWAQQTPPQQPPLRSGARTVAVYATVTDKEGRLVPDLGARSIRGPRQRETSAADRVLQ